MIGIEEPDVIVDISAKDGVAVGAEVELWRPVRLVHPVTKRVVMDRYRLGTLRLVQVRDAIALARVSGTPLKPPAIGDVVLVPPATVTEAPASGLASAPPSGGSALTERGPSVPSIAAANEAPGTPVDAEAAAVTHLFERLQGASLVSRIRQYERYARMHPNGQYSRVLLEEAAALRELVSLREQGSADAPAVRHFDAPDHALDATPLMFAVELSGAVVGAVLQVSSGRERAYRSIPMVAAGPGYYTATIPADRVKAPVVEYFIDAVRPSGAVVPVAGTPEAPLKLAVDAVPHAAGRLSHDTSVSLLTDYADYNRLRGNDRTWQTEGAFTMRFSDIGVRAVRSGFGVYRGVGGSIHDLDEAGLASRPVGLTYGYVEGEFGFKPNVSLIVRALLGLRNVGTAGGAAVAMRIGSDRSTNLLFGGEVLGGIGLRGMTELQINPAGKVPIAIRSEVTNQPAGSGVANRADDPSLRADQSIAAGDVGVRAIAQVGYRIVPQFVLAVRTSYQGRTISHAGPGVGGAAEYQW